MPLSKKQNVWVAAFDGGKALIYRNDGTPKTPKLKKVLALDPEIPPDRELSADKPGRYPDPSKGFSAVENTDRHALEKARFIESVVEKLNARAAKGAFARLVVFAPAPALGAARPHYSAALKALIDPEIEADVTSEPVKKLEKRLSDILMP